MAELQLTAHFPGAEDIGINLPVIAIDDDFFEFIEDELCYTGGPIDIGLFALYYLEWEKVMVK